MSPEREQVLAEVARHVLSFAPGHPLRVGVDGVCGAGKTTFTRELVQRLGATGRAVVHVDSDGFHHVRERRRRRGPMSARGYYEDAYDFETLLQRVLLPLGPGGSREDAVRVHDLATDEIVIDETDTAPPDVTTTRGVARDAAALGGDEAARAAYDSRYAAACAIYLAEESPEERATIVVQHDDPSRPRIILKR